MKLAIIWANYGPYHLARLKAVREAFDRENVLAIQLSSSTQTYNWLVDAQQQDEVVTLYEDVPNERIPWLPLLFRLLKLFWRVKPAVCFVPSYWPASSVAIILAAKLNGIRCVMMNDTHGGTAQLKIWKVLAKKLCIRAFFDAGLVAGTLQQAYFQKLGLPKDRLFLGYDVVDNDYFATRAKQVLEQREQNRKAYQLPDKYILSLGRFVGKKNLPVLIQAYRILLDQWPNPNGVLPHLVFVGSGEQESVMKQLCHDLHLPVYDKTDLQDIGNQPSAAYSPGVHFYGFRQIKDNPVFYALASVFVLPSHFEEWGLVVNEAMASGLPVVVSQTAGCAPDLVKEGVNGLTFNPENPEDLAEKLRVILSNPDKQADMGKQSQQLIDLWSCALFAKNVKNAANAALTP